MSKVTSIEEYIFEINELNKKWDLDQNTMHVWSRGHADTNWELSPGIYRQGDSKYERELLRDFKLSSARFLDYTPNRELEWLFIMQHYGMPTRLLDWTESHLIALYFAVVNYSNTNDGCVWVIDPWTLNQNSILQQSVPTIDHPAMSDYEINSDPQVFIREVKAKMPVAIRPTRSTPRIIAQRGTFTIHGKKKGGVDIKDICRNTKIEIDGSCKLSILKQLYFGGITHSVLFPEISGLSKEISFRYSQDYLNDKNAHFHPGF